MELESRLSNDVLYRCTNGPPKVLDGLKRMFSTNVSSYTLDPEQHGFELCTSALGFFFSPSGEYYMLHNLSVIGTKETDGQL